MACIKQPRAMLMLLMCMFFGVKETTASYCANKFIYYAKGDTCLKPFYQKKYFRDAERHCTYPGGHLAIINNEDMAQYIAELFLSTYWIGAKFDSKDTTFRYVNGKPLGDFQPWIEGQSNTKQPARALCVGAGPKLKEDKGKWTQLVCGQMHEYVCETKPRPGRNPRQTTSPSTDQECPLFYKYYGPDTSCLRGYPYRMKYHEAKDVCKKDGGFVVKIKDDAKRKYIVDNFGLDHPFWLGIEYSQQLGKFTYSDGELLGSYQPWMGSQSNTFKSDGGECVHGMSIYSNDAEKWNQAPCTGWIYFACQIGDSKTTTTTTTEESTTEDIKLTTQSTTQANQVEYTTTQPSVGKTTTEAVIKTTPPPIGPTSRPLGNDPSAQQPSDQPTQQTNGPTDLQTVNQSTEKRKSGHYQRINLDLFWHSTN